jgi:hypothetical protein
MPGGPNYPHDQSTRYPLSAREGIPIFRAADPIQGIILTPEGDIRTWVISSGVQTTHRDLITALAYLDIADRVAAEHDAREAQRFAAATAEVANLRGEVRQLRDAVDEMAKLVRALVGFLGVVVPNWRNRSEIEHGDDMGMVLPSAEAIGLVIEIVPLQREPGYEHEEVVSMEPPAGTLVARGSTVRVRMSFMG